MLLHAESVVPVRYEVRGPCPCESSTRAFPFNRTPSVRPASSYSPVNRFEIFGVGQPAVGPHREDDRLQAGLERNRQAIDIALHVGQELHLLVLEGWVLGVLQGVEHLEVPVLERGFDTVIGEVELAVAQLDLDDSVAGVLVFAGVFLQLVGGSRPGPANRVFLGLGLFGGSLVLGFLAELLTIPIDRGRPKSRSAACRVIISGKPVPPMLARTTMPRSSSGKRVVEATKPSIAPPWCTRRWPR